MEQMNEYKSFGMLCRKHFEELKDFVKQLKDAVEQEISERMIHLRRSVIGEVFSLENIFSREKKIRGESFWKHLSRDKPLD